MTKKFQNKNNYLVGIISDTHGRLPHSVAEAFNGVDLIIHAGDIGEPNIIKALEKIAPTIAVRGNMDMGQWARQLPTDEAIEISRTLLYVIHDVYRLKLKPNIAAPNVVISGHTHRPLQEENQGVLYVNPGSAGYPKYGHPATVALLQIKGQSLQAQIIELNKIARSDILRFAFVRIPFFNPGQPALTAG
jgi:putative phosphoesterase